MTANDEQWLAEAEARCAATPWLYGADLPRALALVRELGEKLLLRELYDDAESRPAISVRQQRDQLAAALRILAGTQAVMETFGGTHITNCRCALCGARAALTTCERTP